MLPVIVPNQQKSASPKVELASTEAAHHGHQRGRQEGNQQAVDERADNGTDTTTRGVAEHTSTTTIEEVRHHTGQDQRDTQTGPSHTAMIARATRPPTKEPRKPISEALAPYGNTIGTSSAGVPGTTLFAMPWKAGRVHRG